MAKQRISIRGTSGPEIEEALRALKTHLGVPGEFSPEVLAEAHEAAAHADLPERDETGVPFVTVDPPGAMDLDQAMCLERRPEGGWRVRYAIADVPAFIRPSGAIDAEARHRGQTIYSPDGNAPLHPRELSEGAASLLPDQDAPAFVWDIRLDAEGAVVGDVALYRAMVRSRAKLDYAGVQKALDAGERDAPFAALPEIGAARRGQEAARGGASLPMPEQEIEKTADGRYETRFRPLLQAEDDNAQLSLLTGFSAAGIMLAGGAGILRTMPEPDPRDVDRFRRQTAALGHPWTEGDYGAYLRTLDRDDSHDLAVIHAATSLFRGAAYTPFDGAAPEITRHAALASEYSHVTAPLRRLVDRFGLLVCDALAGGHEVPDWVRAALPEIPAVMAASDKLQGAMERGASDIVEAAGLVGREGEEFDGVAVESIRNGVLVQLAEPAVLAPAHGDARPGDAVRLRLAEVQLTSPAVRFDIVR